MRSSRTVGVAVRSSDLQGRTGCNLLECVLLLFAYIVTLLFICGEIVTNGVLKGVGERGMALSVTSL